MRRSICAVCTVVVLLPGVLAAPPEQTKTSHYVRVKAAAGKVDAKGRQTITVLVKIEQGCTLIGNNVPDDLAPHRFEVVFTVNGKPAKAEITYPMGHVKKDSIVGDYTVYRGEVSVTAVLQRNAGEPGPVEAGVVMQGLVAKGY